MGAAYRLQPRYLRIADGGSADPLTEAELSRIWAAQSFPPEALTLADGRRLRIVVPGRPGGGSGPDYRDAIVAIDGVERRGDLELHVRASSFQTHGHHHDAAYDNLVLHVVYAADDGVATRLHSGAAVSVASFAPWVGERTQQLRDWLEAPPLWLEPCSDAASRLGAGAVLTRLEEEGKRRFALKVERLQEAVASLGEDQALWQALLDVLGYGKDRAAWRRLAELVPVALLRQLGACLPPNEAADRVQSALLATAGLAAPPDDLLPFLPRPLAVPLSGGSRPAARPERRLRALATLWQRAAGDLPTYARRPFAFSAVATVKDLTTDWTVPDPLGGPALLGPDRARELLLNAVLPFAALDSALTAQAEAAAAGLPAAPAYGKTAFLENNLRRSEPVLRVRSARQQQGLLAMVGDWCRQGGCGRCPLS